MAPKAVLAEQIAALVNAGVTQFLSEIAEATDTWRVLSVLYLREQNPTIKLHCILPCKEQANTQVFPGVNEMFSSPDRADGNQKWVDFIMTFWHCECIALINRPVDKVVKKSSRSR